VIALVFLLVAQTAEAEQSAFERIEQLHAAAAPEPEPPPGLRAPPGTDRHKKALERYAADLKAWEQRERKRSAELEKLARSFLQRYPDSKHGLRVLLWRGCAYLELREFKKAVVVLGVAVVRGKEQARAPLVQAFRALGEFDSAVNVGGPQPELLEEAGRVEEAIEAALKGGRPDLAKAWRQIGKKPKFEVEIPEGCRALVIEAGKSLDPLLKRHLKARFGKRGLRFQPGPKKIGSVFLTDAKACISAVSPRGDTWKFRISRLLGTD